MGKSPQDHADLETRQIQKHPGKLLDCVSDTHTHMVPYAIYASVLQSASKCLLVQIMQHYNLRLAHALGLREEHLTSWGHLAQQDCQLYLFQGWHC